MKSKYLRWVIFGLYILAIPALVYLIGNFYVYLFDGWKLNAEKMENAGTVLGILVTASFPLWAMHSIVKMDEKDDYER